MAHSGGRKQPFRALTNAEQATLKQFHEDVHYSHRYTDDDFEYRHVILPKLMLKSIPKDYFDHQSGTLRMLHEDEWRAMGITQSLGWVHYETHQPEPWILLFKRPLADE